MSKLNTLRDEKAKIHDTDSLYGFMYIDRFKDGWDALEALNLSVLFAEWCKYGKYEAYKNIVRDCNSRGLSSEETTKELYDYWIKEIYTP